MTPAEEDARKAFEQWYALNAFDYESNPIGSRECGLQWAAWQAAVAQERERAEKSERVDLNKDGTLDGIVGSPAYLEQMDFNHWFLSIGNHAVWLHSRTKITASYERRETFAAIREGEKL